ncbi:SAM-dependent methyltransferase [Candidatus Microgenomates bacterium]|nr:MAG: SAM-dependent methyltransferase [Candidatus Microgenomates bacterium]
MHLFFNNKVVNDIGNSNKEHREKWLKKTLLKLGKGKRILDAGAGELQYKKYCKHLRYVSQDFGQYSGEGDGIGLQMGGWDNSKLDIVSDILDIPVKDKSFDAIMCVEVLEHIPYPDKAIKEFARIIKSNGKLIITAPFCSMTHFSPYFYSTGFSKYWYEEVLKKHGFEIEEISYNGNYFEYYAQETRRLYYMAEKYTNTNLALKRKNIKLIEGMLSLLDKINAKQKKSEEMMCFGIHILARKVS